MHKQNLPAGRLLPVEQKVESLRYSSGILFLLIVCAAHCRVFVNGIKGKPYTVSFISCDSPYGGSQLTADRKRSAEAYVVERINQVAGRVGTRSNGSKVHDDFSSEKPEPSAS